MLDTKRCARCKQTLPTAEFGPGKRWGDGFFPYCRPCKRASDKASRERHAEELRAKAKARYAADPEPFKARSRAQYQRDPSAWKKYAADWVARNPEKKKEASRKWQQANMQGKVRESVRRRYATRKGAPAIKFSPEQLADRRRYFGDKCWMCRGPAQEWDHVKPLVKGGWHCLSNLRPACRRCNASKNDRWPL
jgi:5-methylcytosine-specific restriction endonuclease McrA